MGGPGLVAGRLRGGHGFPGGVEGGFGAVGPGAGPLGGGEVLLGHLAEAGGGRLLPISLGGRGRRPGFGLGDPEAGVLQFPGDPVGVGDRQRPLDFGGQPAEVDGQGLQGGGDLRRRPARRAGPVGRTGPPRANGATGEPRTRR